MTRRCPSQFEELGRVTEGYSGADVAILVRDALMEPIRTLQVTRTAPRVVRHSPQAAVYMLLSRNS